MASKGLQAIRRRIEVDWRDRAAAESKALLIRTAEAGHARIMAEQTARAGVAPSWQAYANTPGNRNLETVILPGPIVYKYDYRREVIIFALQALRAASPVVSGLYRDSHTLFINGLPVETVPQTILPTDDVMIANPVDYARRIEVGVTKAGRAFVIQVPPRIYERITKSVLVPRYRSVAKISFGYTTIPDAYVVKGKLSARYINKHGKNRKRRQRAGEAVRAPAITIGLP